MLCCMPATRTQVHLQPHQRQRLDEPVDPTTTLDSTFGAAPEAQVPGRDDWAVRSERLKAAE